MDQRLARIVRWMADPIGRITRWVILTCLFFLVLVTVWLLSPSDFSASAKSFLWVVAGGWLTYVCSILLLEVALHEWIRRRLAWIPTSDLIRESRTWPSYGKFQVAQQLQLRVLVDDDPMARTFMIGEDWDGIRESEPRGLRAYWKAVDRKFPNHAKSRMTKAALLAGLALSWASGAALELKFPTVPAIYFRFAKYAFLIAWVSASAPTSYLEGNGDSTLAGKVNRWLQSHPDAVGTYSWESFAGEPLSDVEMRIQDHLGIEFKWAPRVWPLLRLSDFRLP